MVALTDGGAPIWTALTVKTGEIMGFLFRPEKLAQDPIRTLSLNVCPYFFFLHAIASHVNFK